MSARAPLRPRLSRSTANSWLRLRRVCDFIKPPPLKLDAGKIKDRGVVASDGLAVVRPELPGRRVRASAPEVLLRHLHDFLGKLVQFLPNCWLTHEWAANFSGCLLVGLRARLARVHIARVKARQRSLCLRFFQSPRRLLPQALGRFLRGDNGRPCCFVE